MLTHIKMVYKETKEKTKDELFYKGLAKKDARELAEILGDEEAIKEYLEDRVIPNRRGSYEMIYYELLEILDDHNASILMDKRDQFIVRKDVSVLWKHFTSEKERKEKEQLKKEKEFQENRIFKIESLMQQLEEKKNIAINKVNQIDEKLGIEKEEAATEEEVNQVFEEFEEEILKSEVETDEKKDKSKEDKKEVLDPLDMIGEGF